MDGTDFEGDFFLCLAATGVAVGGGGREEGEMPTRRALTRKHGDVELLWNVGTRLSAGLTDGRRRRVGGRGSS